jgi:hypothetical protein
MQTLDLNITMLSPSAISVAKRKSLSINALTSTTIQVILHNRHQSPISSYNDPLTHVQFDNRQYIPQMRNLLHDTNGLSTIRPTPMKMHLERTTNPPTPSLNFAYSKQCDVKATKRLM